MVLEESSWEIKSGKSYPQLTENIEADVVIMGAGIAGIFNAYILSKAGLKVVVLEKNEKILQNATMYTTAFVTKVIDTSFDRLVNLFGEDKAKLIWESGQDAIDLIVQIAQKEDIDCEFKFVSSFTYAQNETEFEGLSKEFRTIKKAGFEADLSKDGSKLNFKNSGFLEIPKQAVCHPIKFAQALASATEFAGAKIYTNSEVLTLEGLTVKTRNGQVRAKNILIATYNPFINQGTSFKKAMYVSYVYELEIAKGLLGEGMYFDMGNPYHYFRIDNYGNSDRMMVGGEDHRKDIKINPDKNFYALEKYIKTVLGSNNYKITRKWSGQILESTDGLALIGEIKPHTFVVTGFSGNGMTYAPLSATIIRDLILVNKNAYADLYSLKRARPLGVLFGKALDYIGEFFGGAFKNFFSSGR